jgi:hypothetical protein
VSPMDTSSRKEISRRSRCSHWSGSCWYGLLVRSLAPCAYSSSRNQRRKPH